METTHTYEVRASSQGKKPALWAGSDSCYTGSFYGLRQRVEDACTMVSLVSIVHIEIVGLRGVYLRRLKAFCRVLKYR